MENSKRIKKVSLEMVDLVNLFKSHLLYLHNISYKEKTNLQLILSQTREDLDEYPTLDEVNTELNEEQVVVEEPLDENLKNQIDNLDNLDEEELLNLKDNLTLNQEE